MITSRLARRCSERTWRTVWRIPRWYVCARATFDGDPFVADNRGRNYTEAGSRPHNLVVNYAYQIPDLSHRWNNLVAKVVGDGWMVSGVTTALSGNKTGFSYSYVNTPTGALTGTGGVSTAGSRVDIVCDPNLPRGQRTFTHQFRTECITPPSDPLRLGNAQGEEKE